MKRLTSKFRSIHHNLSVEENKVVKIKLSPPFPNNPNLWIVYFYGQDEQVVRTWTYDSEANRRKDLALVLMKHPHLEVV